MRRYDMSHARVARFCSVLAVTVPTVIGVDAARAEQPPPPCHPNPNAAADEAAVRGRGDVINLPGELAGSVGSAGQPTAYVSAIAGVQRSGQPQPAVPVLPAGHNRFRTERVYDHFSGSERPRAAECHRRKLRIAYGGCRARRAGARTTRARSTMCSPTSLRCSSSTTRVAGTKGG